MKILAIISGGQVVNVVQIEVGANGWQPAEGQQAVDITANDPQPGMGWAYDGQAFTPPAPVPPPEPTPESIYGEAVAAGYDTGAGFRLALGDDDRALFTQMVVLILAALAAAQTEEQRDAVMASAAPVKDKEGVMHLLNVAQALPILLAYGNAYKNIWLAKQGGNP